ncbi:MAG TPA: FAD-dependent oxidoreductase, partial [Agitococcus sp.]|nr:FAD-dependent oxidoreductase [Agitococcus sp.]
MSNQVCLIIGASHAAAQLATSLRQEGWQGDIIMIGDEAYLPYHRPPLSKTFLAGDKEIDDLLIRPASFYDKSAIQFKQGRVTYIDRQQQKITLNDGTQLNYDKLALCLGARVRTAGLTGENLAGVHYLRNIADIQAIKPYVVQ